jgi:hypothetical protein
MDTNHDTTTETEDTQTALSNSDTQQVGGEEDETLEQIFDKILKGNAKAADYKEGYLQEVRASEAEGWVRTRVARTHGSVCEWWEKDDKRMMIGGVPELPEECPSTNSQFMQEFMDDKLKWTLTVCVHGVYTTGAGKYNKETYTSLTGDDNRAQDKVQEEIYDLFLKPGTKNPRKDPAVMENDSLSNDEYADLIKNAYTLRPMEEIEVWAEDFGSWMVGQDCKEEYPHYRGFSGRWCVDRELIRMIAVYEVNILGTDAARRVMDYFRTNTRLKIVYARAECRTDSGNPWIL